MPLLGSQRRCSSTNAAAFPCIVAAFAAVWVAVVFVVVVVVVAAVVVAVGAAAAVVAVAVGVVVASASELAAPVAFTSGAGAGRGMIWGGTVRAHSGKPSMEVTAVATARSTVQGKTNSRIVPPVAQLMQLCLHL